jgi:hypothetical protein
MREKLPTGLGWLLDLGTPPGYPTQEEAQSKGWNVWSIDLRGEPFRVLDRIHTVGDFNEMYFGRTFDMVLNISTIEHFGLAGRYGVVDPDPDADLRAMEKLASLMESHARMVMTIPVGKDAVFTPWHRIYGDERFPQLIKDFTVLESRFWVKRDGVDRYVVGSRKEAFGTTPQPPPNHYYALGGFVLGVP